MKTNINRKSKFLILNLLITFSLLIIMYKIQETPYASFKVLLIGILCLELIYFSFRLIKVKECISMNIVRQVLNISVLLAFFVISAIMSNITIKDRMKSIITLYTLSIYLVALFTYLYWNKVHDSSKSNIQKLKLAIVQNKILIGTILFSFLIRLNQLGTLFRWDAGEYYSKLSAACHGFDFSIRQILTNFGLCGHPMYGYALISAIGEFWFPQKMIGVQIINLVLTLFAIKFIFVIFQKHFKIDMKMSLIFTLLASVSATFLGTSTYYHPDYGIAIFVIFVLYFWLEKKYILMAFWACTLCMTKEIGVLLYATFAFSYLLVLLISSKGRFLVRLKAIILSPMLWVSSIPGCLYLLYMKVVGGISSWKQNSEAESNFVWNSNGENCFGFNPEYIFVKIKQLFFMNFKWIITIILVVAVIYSLILYLKQKRHNLSATFIASCLMGAMYCVFSFLYITAPLARYNIVFDLLVILLLAYLYSFITKNASYTGKFPDIIVFPIICAISILCLGQSYISIDPISFRLFNKLYTGATPLLYPTLSTSTYYGDYLVYNNQYTFIDRGYEEILKNIGYDGHQVVFFPGDGAGLHIDGNGQVYVVNWNTSEKKRTFSNSEDTIPINTSSISNLDYLWETNNLAENAVVFFLPYYDYSEKEELSKLSNYYDIGQRNVYHEYGGELYYYFLTKK